MLEFAAFLLGLFGFALLHAAAPSRFPYSAGATRWVGWTPATRLSAAVVLALSLALACKAEGLAEGIVFSIIGWALAGAAFVFAAPVIKRLAWIAAMASPLLALVLIAVWRLRGNR